MYLKWAVIRKYCQNILQISKTIYRMSEDGGFKSPKGC